METMELNQANSVNNGINFNKLRAVAMTTVAILGGSAIAASPAFASGTERAPISCPDNSPDPSADPCTGQEDGTVITITDYNDYPATDPGTKNTHYAYPTGDSEDKLNVSYGVRDNYHHANTASDQDTCNVFPSDGRTAENCTTWDSTHNPDGTNKTTTTTTTTTGGGTTTTTPTPGEISLKHTAYCVEEATHLYDAQDGTAKTSFSFTIPAKRKGKATIQVPAMHKVNPGCDDVAVKLTVTEQIKDSRNKHMQHQRNISSKFAVLTPKENNGNKHATKFAHRALKRGRFLFAVLTANATAIDAVTGQKVSAPHPRTFHTTPNKVR